MPSSTLHPRLTPVGGGTPIWLAEIGPYGAWGDLSYTTRWGDSASGMYEASCTFPLPPDFEHATLRRGSLFELMEDGYRVGCPLVLSDPSKGTEPGQPWTLTATGIGRDVEGSDAFTALDGSLNTTAIPSTAATQAKARGWRITTVGASVPVTAVGASSTTEGLNSTGALLTAAGEGLGQRWGVDREGTLFFSIDPGSPAYQTVPNAVTLSTADDNYATTVFGRYLDLATGSYLTVQATNAPVATVFGRKEYNVDLTPLGKIATATAQGFADGILARSKGRLAYTNSITVSSQQLLTMGGGRANLTQVAEDVGQGCMVRLHGITSDLLAFTGKTYLDVVIGEARRRDGEDLIDLAPVGLAARDLAAVVEEITHMGAMAA